MKLLSARKSGYCWQPAWCSREWFHSFSVWNSAV